MVKKHMTYYIHVILQEKKSKDKRKTKQSKVLAEGNDGTIIQNADGSQEIIINEEVSKKTKN